MSQNIKIKNLAAYLFALLLFFATAQLMMAQGSQNAIVSISDNSLGDLRSAIKSDNYGLRKSGIYLAGKHSVSQVSQTLLEQLKVEEDPDLRILIIRVLYILDDTKYADAISNVASNDENSRVRNMASSIYSVMKINNFQNIAEKDNSSRVLK